MATPQYKHLEWDYPPGSSVYRKVTHFGVNL